MRSEGACSWAPMLPGCGALCLPTEVLLHNEAGKGAGGGCLLPEGLAPGPWHSEVSGS